MCGATRTECPNRKSRTYLNTCIWDCLGQYNNEPEVTSWGFKLIWLFCLIYGQENTKLKIHILFKFQIILPSFESIFMHIARIVFAFSNLNPNIDVIALGPSPTRMMKKWELRENLWWTLKVEMWASAISLSIWIRGNGAISACKSFKIIVIMTYRNIFKSSQSTSWNESGYFQIQIIIILNRNRNKPKKFMSMVTYN